MTDHTILAMINIALTLPWRIIPCWGPSKAMQVPNNIQRTALWRGAHRRGTRTVCDEPPGDKRNTGCDKKIEEREDGHASSDRRAAAEVLEHLSAIDWVIVTAMLRDGFLLTDVDDAGR